jgi:hypothetical protein
MKPQHKFRLLQLVTKIKPELARHLIISLFQKFLVFSHHLQEIQRRII